MEILSYLIQFWEFALIGLIFVLELLARWVDRSKETKHLFTYDEMPAMRPVRIPTDGNGVFEAMWTWVMKSRQWELVEDFHYSIDGVDYIVPAGFVCDATSIPKFMRAVISPTGILLIGGLVHDYGYRYRCLRLATGEDTIKHGQKHFDEIFRDINVQDNGFKSINYLSYYALRMFGWFAWRQNRKEEKE